jgi:hypothetical protein
MLDLLPPHHCTPFIERPGSSIDDLARELKGLALLLPESVVGATQTSKVNATRTSGSYQRSKNPPQRKETRTCHYCKKVGHLASECRKKMRDAERRQGEPATIMTVTANSIHQLKGRDNSIWLDSGATHHVIHNQGMLRNTRAPTVSTVVLGGGEEHAVICEGDLLLTGGPKGSVLLTSVLHVPTLGINLMSTPQLTNKKGSCWEGEHFANIYDPQGRVILRGHKLDGMYRIDCHDEWASTTTRSVSGQSSCYCSDF